MDGVETGWTEQQSRGLAGTKWTKFIHRAKVGIAGSNLVFRSQSTPEGRDNDTPGQDTETTPDAPANRDTDGGAERRGGGGAAETPRGGALRGRGKEGPYPLCRRFVHNGARGRGGAVASGEGRWGVVAWEGARRKKRAVAWEKTTRKGRPERIRHLCNASHFRTYRTLGDTSGG